MAVSYFMAFVLAPHNKAHNYPITLYKVAQSPMKNYAVKQDVAKINIFDWIQNELMCKQVSEWVSEWMNEWMNEWWMNEKNE